MAINSRAAHTGEPPLDSHKRVPSPLAAIPPIPPGTIVFQVQLILYVCVVVIV